MPREFTDTCAMVQVNDIPYSQVKGVWNYLRSKRGMLDQNFTVLGVCIEEVWVN